MLTLLSEGAGSDAGVMAPRHRDTTGHPHLLGAGRSPQQKNKEMQGGHHQHLLLPQQGQASRSASTPGWGARRVLSLGKEPASISLPSPPAQGETTLRCQLQLGFVAFPNYNNKKNKQKG